jgi:hypothetical protein
MGNSGWVSEAVEEACRRAEEWYLGLPWFSPRVNLGSVVGFRHPAILSEQDCVMQFARFLNESGVAWEAIHHEVSASRWLFAAPHPAATPDLRRWRVDLALLGSEDFLAAELPAEEPGFRFDAFLEFAYLGDFWTAENSVAWGEPEKGRAKVGADVEKISGYLERAVCEAGYVIVFEECDYGFPPEFAAAAEARHDCRVRFVRGYEA